jgi:hypothetical protein
MAASAKGQPEYSYEGRVEYYEFYINGHFLQCIFEENRFYGHILRQWAIDGNDRTTVRCKYPSFEPDFLLCDCSNGSIGERPFENGSIKYEFFIKPLGLDPKPFEYQEYTDKIGYRITPFDLKRVLYGEDWFMRMSHLPSKHPVNEKIHELFSN